MKFQVEVKSGGKEYPELSFEQVKELVRLMNEGHTEEEALEMIK